MNAQAAASRSGIDATRRCILEEAQALFTRFGYAKTSMADIAGRMGMSTGNLYRYYRNKEAIGDAVVSAWLDDSEALLDGALATATDPEDRIRRVITLSVAALVNEMRRSPRMMDLTEFLNVSEAASARVQRHIAFKRDRIVAALEEGMADGRFRRADAYATAVALLNAAKAFQTPQGLSAWRDHDTILPELQMVLDLVFTGVRADGD